MSHLTVTCRCTRPMRQEPGRPAGYLMCSCGNRVRLDDQRRTTCVIRDDERDEPCRNQVAMRHPVALCRPHIMRLAEAPEFAWPTVTDVMVKTYNTRLTKEQAEQARVEEMKRRRRAYEEELRRHQLKAQELVYYIALRGVIKIGYTTNMATRMNTLMPDAVLATEPGDLAFEKRRHQQFKHLRAPLGREYFSVHTELLTHIETVLAEHGPPKLTGYPSYDTWHLGDHMLVPAKVAAKLAGVSLRTMYEWIHGERLTVTRPRGKRGVLVNALEAQELAGLRGSGGRLPRLDHAS